MICLIGLAAGFVVGTLSNRGENYGCLFGVLIYVGG